MRHLNKRLERWIKWTLYNWITCHSYNSTNVISMSNVQWFNCTNSTPTDVQLKWKQVKTSKNQVKNLNLYLLFSIIPFSVTSSVVTACLLYWLFIKKTGRLEPWSCHSLIRLIRVSNLAKGSTNNFIILPYGASVTSAEHNPNTKSKS